MSSRIFISYRRNDSRGSTGRIYDHLAAHFGQDNIFMDVDTIQPGLDFVNEIETAVNHVDVLVAVIGPSWLNSMNAEGQRRLDNPEDFVRLEIAAALCRNIRVIPVLVEGATPPTSEALPDNLQALARRNAIEISHSRFNADMQRLIQVIESVLQKAPGTVTSPPVKQKASKKSTQTTQLKLWQKPFAAGWLGIGIPVILLGLFYLYSLGESCANPDNAIIAAIISFPISVFLMLKKRQTFTLFWLLITGVNFIISSPHGFPHGAMSLSPIFRVRMGSECQTFAYDNYYLFGFVTVALVLNLVYLSLQKKKMKA